MQLLERRCAARAADPAEARAGAPGRFLRLHAIATTGLLGVVLDRPRATDRTLDLGPGELLLVDESLARAMDGFVLDRDERGGLSLRTTGTGAGGDVRPQAQQTTMRRGPS